MATSVNWVVLDQTAGPAVQVGDLICADAGGMPTYRVVAVEDGQAWLRDGYDDRVWIRPLAAFRWKACQTNGTMTDFEQNSPNAL
jgi:hypothetical protein